VTQVAHFDIEYTQFLDVNGKATQDLPEFAKESENLIALYKNMMLTRIFDTKAIALQRTGKMGTYPSSLGQEGFSSAIGFTMKPEDVLVPYYRDYAAQFQRGVTLAEMYAFWGGDERGMCFQSDMAHDDLPVSVPIASQCLHATGVASAFKIRKQPRVAVTTLGDGGTSEGDFYEAINVAGAWGLPVVFVVNNNKWAISVPLRKQTHSETIAQKALAAGFKGEQVDGNDVIALVHTIGNAIENARKGGGPTLVESITYRLCDHTTADDAGRYQPKAELEKAWQEEPILRLNKYLTHQKIWDEQKEAALKKSCAEEVEAAVKTYQSASPQSPEAMFDHLYGKLPHSLEEQRQQVMEGK